MAYPASSLSRVCRAIADFVSVGIDASAHSVRVLLGTPAEAAKTSDSQHRVNLFFYRLEPAALGPGPSADETWWIRLHCLITCFGVMEEQISAGENELRLLGEVLRLFHESPALEPLDVDGESVQLQAIFQPLTVDELNHLWSTQSETSFRTSLAYEMVLAPVVPRSPAIEAPRVGAIGQQVGIAPAARRQDFVGTAAAPPVAAVTVDIAASEWAPQICLVVGGDCQQSLALPVAEVQTGSFIPEVWIAGEDGAAVTLRWQIWDSEQGWRDAKASSVETT
ncbi:MAG: DUF4255 domain-containing protein, partial [Acidobacteriota bacterium]